MPGASAARHRAFGQQARTLGKPRSRDSPQAGHKSDAHGAVAWPRSAGHGQHQRHADCRRRWPCVPNPKRITAREQPPPCKSVRLLLDGGLRRCRPRRRAAWRSTWRATAAISIGSTTTSPTRQRVGVRTVRESIGWRIAEPRPALRPESRAVAVAHAARTPWRAGAVDADALRHARPTSACSTTRWSNASPHFAAVVARRLAPLHDTAPVYTLINEIGFLSWAASAHADRPHGPCPAPTVDGADDRRMRQRLRGQAPPGARGARRHRGGAAGRSARALPARRAGGARGRRRATDPICSRRPIAIAAYQWQAWDMLARPPRTGARRSSAMRSTWSASTTTTAASGRCRPSAVCTGTDHDPRRRPLAELLTAVWRRYGRPLVARRDQPCRHRPRRLAGRRWPAGRQRARRRRAGRRHLPVPAGRPPDWDDRRPLAPQRPVGRAPPRRAPRRRGAASCSSTTPATRWRAGSAPSRLPICEGASRCHPDRLLPPALGLRLPAPAAPDVAHWRRTIASSSSRSRCRATARRASGLHAARRRASRCWCRTRRSPRPASTTTSCRCCGRCSNDYLRDQRHRRHRSSGSTRRWRCRCSARCSPRAVVYDCMDELRAFKDAPRQLRQREAALLQAADLVFTGGPSLYEAKRAPPSATCTACRARVDAAHFAPATLRRGSAEAAARPRCSGDRRSRGSASSA